MAKCKKCGVDTKGGFTLCFACLQKQKEKEFYKYGKHKCKGGCGTIIPGNKIYCYPCYLKNTK